MTIEGETPAEKMRACCEAIIKGEFMNVVPELSPQALMEAMALAQGFMTGGIPTAASLPEGAPMPTSYSIDGEEVADGQHVFKLHFNANEHDLHATCGWGQIDGAWKITTIRIDSAT
jgi:hypothetical protein